MANKKSSVEKTFNGFVAFESDEAKRVLAEKQKNEFPVLTTADGKTVLFRQIKWQEVTYKGRTFDVPVIAAMCGNEQKQVTLSTLFGKEYTFVVDRDKGAFKKGDKYQINNLVVWSPDLQSSTSSRNIAVMEQITDGKEITLQTIWGHADNENKRSFNLTFVVETAKKL